MLPSGNGNRSESMFLSTGTAVAASAHDTVLCYGNQGGAAEAYQCDAIAALGVRKLYRYTGSDWASTIVPPIANVNYLYTLTNNGTHDVFTQNGTLTYTLAHSTAALTSGSALVIGSYIGAGAHRLFNSTLTEARVYNRTNTPDWSIAEWAQTAKVGVKEMYNIISFTVNASAGGYAIGNNSSLTPPINVTILAIPSAGYYLSNWTENCNGAIANTTKLSTTIEINDNIACYARANFELLPSSLYIKTAINSYNGTHINYSFTGIVINNGSITSTNVNVSIAANSTLLSSAIVNITVGKVYTLQTNWAIARPNLDKNFTVVVNIPQYGVYMVSDSAFIILPIDPPSAINLMSNGGKTRCRTPQDVGYWDGSDWRINASWGCNYSDQTITLPSSGIKIVDNGEVSFSNSNIVVNFLERLAGDVGTAATIVFKAVGSVLFQ
jgi:hypothetical protein